MKRLELACVCGRPVALRDRIAPLARRRCPECGSTSRRWMRSWPSWLRWIRRRPWPASRPGRGPRHFAPDWGFLPSSLTRFTPGAAAALRLRRRKNRWRFEQL